nr:reverse transcriptase domain-containing protein [Tanacetum cinerariifolium]
MLSGFFQNQASTLGTLLSNTILNPKGEMKEITTRSGVAYKGPSIPTNPSPKKVVERETEETIDKEQTNFQGSTAHIQPPVVPIPEPDVSKTLPKPNIPYPSRLNDQKLREKLRIKWRIVDFEADLRVPLILGRSFLRTGRDLIDVYGEEITLRVNDEAVTFNLNHTTRYSSTYDDMSVNRIDVIDVAREEYDQEMLGFSKNSSGGNPTSTSEPIISDSSPSLTPFKGSDFILEEIEAYLKDEWLEQGDKAENKDKGKSHVVTITGFRDLNEEFAECINNSSNGVNAAGSSVFVAGLNFTNNTNDFSDAGPSDAAMPNLEDLSDNADDVGAEADINNMESIISVSPILTSRIHKDHPTSQIIGDLSSTTQIRSMARGVRDQEEPKRIHQDLKDPSWIEAIQEELLQFKMQKVRILVDLPYGKRGI